MVGKGVRVTVEIVHAGEWCWEWVGWVGNG